MRSLQLIALLALAGCGRDLVKPIDPPKVVKVVVEKTVPVPEELTKPCPLGTKRNNSVREAVRLANERLEIIKTCANGDKAKIRELGSP